MFVVIFKIYSLSSPLMVNIYISIYGYWGSGRMSIVSVKNINHEAQKEIG